MKTKIVLIALILVALVGCNPTPAANVYLVGDSNWPATELSGTMHIMKQNPYLTVIDTWPGLGVVRDDSPYSDGYASARLSAIINAAPIDFIVTNFGGNDASYSQAEFTQAASSFIESAGATKIIWIKPAAVGPNAANISAFGEILDSLQSQYQNLWVVPYDEVIASVGACPSLVNYSVIMLDRSRCYVDAENDVHLSDEGRLVLAVVARVATDMASGNEWRGDIMSKANDILTILGS